MRIRVTEEHIRKGVPFSACDCPVALAIKEATGHGWVSVGIGGVSLSDPERPGHVGRRYRLPPAVDAWTKKFDSLPTRELFLVRLGASRIDTIEFDLED